MNQAHDILRRLFNAMEPPRSAVATRVWDEAREFLRRPPMVGGPDEVDALAYMITGTPTGRSLLDLWPTRRIGKSPLLGMPYGPSPRRMNADDLTWTDGPAYDALVDLERRDMERKRDLYLEMWRAMELAPLAFQKPVFFGMDLAKEEPEPDNP